MKIFLSYAQKDSALARDLAKRLTRGGFRVWNRDVEIEPGENWAKKTGKALDAADFIVFLLTPAALDSDTVRNDIDFALMSTKFAHRVFSVMVGAPKQAETEAPWILRRLPHRQVESEANFGDAVRDIKALWAAANKSSSND